MLENIEAIIFDFDGVLVESTSVKADAFVALYQSEGPEIAGRVGEYHRRNAGVSRYDKFQYFETVLLRRPPPTHERIAALDSAFSALVEDRVVSSAEVPGAHELLRLAAATVPLHVVSATPEAELYRVVCRRQWNSYFRSLHGSPKQKIENMSLVLRRGNYNPDHVLMIGDAVADFNAASNSGTAFLGRVPRNHDNPFPPGIPIVRDMYEAVKLLQP